jgi:hypothetical protein
MMREIYRVLCLLALLALPAPLLAFKPYTHNTSAYEAYNDVVDNGYVTINGREYKVPDGVVNALRSYPAVYNAGVIGPDGFPDLTYGQSVIHPTETGAWLRHLLTEAQKYQSRPDFIYGVEKVKALAFTYGFLTHAAGDMWGHTFVNDFARGVFPDLSQILSSPEHAAIAVRHIAVEGYIGDATPGFDGNREDRTQAPGGFRVCDIFSEGPDISDDSTPGVVYDAPHLFIAETLVLPQAKTPSTSRGPVIDIFLTLRAGLQGTMKSASVPASSSLEEAVASAADTVAALEEMEEACAGARGGCGTPFSMEYAAVQVTHEATSLFPTYAEEWIKDIDVGLAHWSQLGLALTNGLFDAQSRRIVQNCFCASSEESSPHRAECEKGVNTLDVLFLRLDPFFSTDFEQQPNLLSMMGAPDQILGLGIPILQSVVDQLTPLISEVLSGFNPLVMGVEEIERWVKQALREEISKVLGIDIDALEQLLTNPAQWVCADQVTMRFPVLGEQTINLFRPGDHLRLDQLLGIPHDHHVPAPGLPASCGRLFDDTELRFASVAALRNTVTMAKLLLLDGPELNRALSDILGRSVTQYQPGHNIMVHARNPEENWLRSIDGDHAWRRDGLPRFCDDGGPCPSSGAIVPERRPAELNGGKGNFPLWESCVLRPAFRALFVDWEGNGFPDLEDAPSPDPNDPQAPVSRLVLAAQKAYSSGGRTWVAANHKFTQSAQDAPAGQAFPDSQLALRRRVYRTGSNPGAYQAASQNSTFTLQGPDGSYSIDIQSADACHGFEGLPEPAEAVRTQTYILDTSPPAIVCNPPFNQEWEPDDTLVLDFVVADGTDGSGVASQSSTVDGFQGLPGVVPTSQGAVLDLFYFEPGTRRVEVSATDNLGHAGGSACTFELHASPQSLAANVDRAHSLGLITGHGIANSLRQKLEAAQKHHDRGNHAAEANVLRTFISELLAQRGKKVDPATADRFINFATDRIATGR